MGSAASITGWILLILGIYSAGAAIGELRRPGGWARMMWELEQSKALQFLTGFFVLVLGAAVYLVNPYNSADWQSILVTVLGAWMMLEGFAFLAFSDWMIKLAKQFMNSGTAVYAWISLALGVIFLAMGYVRLLAT